MTLAVVQSETIDGVVLTVAPDGERRVRDLEIGARAGLAQPINVRKVIRANRAELEAHGELVSRREITSGSLGKSSTVFFLNEDQAVALVAMLRTSKARELRILLVRVFGAVRRREAPIALSLDVAHGARVGEVPNMKADVSALCAMAARASNTSLRRVHGFVRRTYKVPGIHHIAVLAWPAVKATLESIALGRLFIEAPRRALPKPDEKQLGLKWGTN